MAEQIPRCNILVTNDDGIDSPGLRAAAQAVLDLGNVTIVAPSHQQTGTGRGLTGDKQARLKPVEYSVNGREVRAYHCECSPAFIVRHSLKTIFRETVPEYDPQVFLKAIDYNDSMV